MDALLDSLRPPAGEAGRPLSDLADRLRFYRDLSQELCRPLITLRAGCDLLLAGCEGPVTDEQRDHLLALRAQCDHLLRLARETLLAEAEPGQGRPLDWAQFRLGALLDEADRQFASRAAAAGVGLSCVLEGDDQAVRTDLACFQDLLARLIDDALTVPADGRAVRLTGRSGIDRWSLEIEGVTPPSARAAAGSKARTLAALLGGSLSFEERPGALHSAILEFRIDPPPLGRSETG